MNFKLFVTSLLGLQSALSSYPQIEQREKISILGVVNKAKRNVNPIRVSYEPVIWDYKLESDLKAALPVNRSELFATNSVYDPGPDIKANMNLRYLTMAPRFYHYKDVNYIFHDTCNNNVNDVLKIFNYRIGQKNCIDFNKCNATEFTNFQSCIAHPIPRVSQNTCSWAWRYYVQMVRDDLKTIACIRFSHPGPYTPNGQKDSFGCYGESKTPTNDKPYVMKLK